MSSTTPPEDTGDSPVPPVESSSLGKHPASESQGEATPSHKKTKAEDAPTTTKPNDDDDVVARKKALRKRVRASIKADLTPEATEAQSQRVWDRLVQLPVYQSATSVGVFLSMPRGEIRTGPILEDAMAAGKRLWVPRVGKNFEKADMDLLEVTDTSPGFYDAWPKNKWGIPEPPPGATGNAANPGDLDLLVVPGLAFDAGGRRLGQGKGYYDRFIARMTASGHKLPLVAVGLDPQFVDGEDIPVAEYDQTMDLVVLPSRIVDPSAPAGAAPGSV